MAGGCTVTATVVDGVWVGSACVETCIVIQRTNYLLQASNYNLAYTNI